MSDPTPSMETKEKTLNTEPLTESSTLNTKPLNTTSKRKADVHELDMSPVVKKRKTMSGTLGRIPSKNDDDDDDDIVMTTCKNTLNLDEEAKLIKELFEVRAERNELKMKYGQLMKTAASFGLLYRSAYLLNQINDPQFESFHEAAATEYNSIAKLAKEMSTQKVEHDNSYSSSIHYFNMAHRMTGDEFYVQASVAGFSHELEYLTKHSDPRFEAIRRKTLQLLTERTKLINKPVNEESKTTLFSLPMLKSQTQGFQALNQIKLMSSLGYEPASETLKQLSSTIGEYFEPKAPTKLPATPKK